MALALIDLASNGRVAFTRLVADDRADVEACHGRLVVRSPMALRGFIEIRGLGIRRLPFEPMAVVRLVVDLAAEDAQRMPLPEATGALVGGISLPRVAVARGTDPLPVVLAAWLLPECEDGGVAPLVAVHNLP